MNPHTAGISDWLSDQSDDILRRIAAGTVNAMNWMMLKALDFVNGGSKINLGAQWLQDMLTMMRYLMLPVVGVLFVLQVATAILSKSPSDLWRAVGGSVLGVLVGAAGAFLVASVLFVVDEFSNYVLGDAQVQAQLAMQRAFAMDGSIDAAGWLIVIVIAGLALVAFVMVIVVLFLRKAIVIGTVAFGPFAAAGLAYGHTKSWVVRWAEVVFALAISKFVISVILTLGFSAISSSITGDTSDALVGAVWIFLAAFSPLSVMKFVSFAGDRMSQAHQVGNGSLQNASSAGGATLGAAGAIGGIAGYAAGKFGGGRGTGGSGGPSAPTSPCSAVGQGLGGPGAAEVSGGADEGAAAPVMSTAGPGSSTATTVMTRGDGTGSPDLPGQIATGRVSDNGAAATAVAGDTQMGSTVVPLAAMSVGPVGVAPMRPPDVAGARTDARGRGETPDRSAPISDPPPNGRHGFRMNQQGELA
ncbi:hypothetical protein ABIB25_005418 [Nakamurella sp. UYEF19]|uniref:hypothetical protein n=1 Tax=Nakamurella sp. UYEF19 TaxID=1756392 RepID=UPI00339B5A4E